MPKHFSISELAREFGVTTRTIRHYEDIGLLAPQRNGQTRVYSPADRTKLKLILRGKRLGFTLEESREIVEMYDPEHGNVDQLQRLIDRIQLQRQKLSDQLDDIAKLMRDLNEAEQGCLEALKKANNSD